MACGKTLNTFRETPMSYGQAPIVCGDALKPCGETRKLMAALQNLFAEPLKAVPGTAMGCAETPRALEETLTELPAALMALPKP